MAARSPTRAGPAGGGPFAAEDPHGHRPDQLRDLTMDSAFVQSMRNELGGSRGGGGGGGDGGSGNDAGRRDQRPPAPQAAAAAKVEAWQAAQPRPAARGAAARRRGWRRLLRCACFAPADEEQPSASALEAPPPSLRPRRTLSGQMSAYGGQRRALDSVLSTYSDIEWFEALSRFETLMSVGTIDDGAAHAAAAGGAGAAAASPPRPSLRRPLTPLPPLVEAGPHAPNPPLIMADRRFEFVPVPPETGFAGYWVRDALRSTPPPLPFDTALGCSRLVARAHETVPGVLVLETPTTWSIVVKPDSIPLGPLSRYVETFRKDGATSAWKLRRDLMLTGKSQGQLYFTSCGTLILRSFAKGMFGGDDFTCEDYIRMEDEGNAVVLRQCVTHLASGRAGVQYMIGAWGGERGPPGY